MPGFGSGPFGGGPGGFGEHDWSRAVLYTALPEPFRVEDENQGDPLLKYSQAQGQVFDALRRNIRDFGDLRDPLLVRTRYNDTEIVYLGKRLDAISEIEQSGVEGSVAANTQFQATRARFKAEDVGKLLFVENSTVLGNNRTVKIATVISQNTIATEPPLLPDAGPLRWSLRDETDSETATFEVLSGDVSRVGPGWILTDGLVLLEVSARRQFKNDGTHTQQTDQEGTDGILSSGTLTSATARFSQQDVGKRLTLSGSVHHENDVKTEVQEVLSPTTVVLADPGLVDDTGPLTWALLKRAEITLASSAALTGHILQEASNASTTAPDTISAPGARFTTDDVGRYITLYKDGSANNDSYQITAVNNGIEVTVSGTLVSDAGPFLWNLRAPTALDDPLSVEVYAPSLLGYLAEDHGVSIDTRESEEFQRRWVASVPRWMNRKGQRDIYEYLGKLTGFDVTVTPLYRVSGEALQEGLVISFEIVGEALEGRYGFGNGTLTLVGSAVRFSSPDASFTEGDVGRQIEVSGSAGGSNDGLRTIETIIDPTTVEFDLLDTMVGLSETDLDWRIVRLYTSLPPGMPVVDEINEDLMVFLKTPIPVQSAADGSLVSTNRLTTPSGQFTSLDVAHRVVISGSGSGNDGVYSVDEVISGTELQLNTTLTTPDANNGSVSWSLEEYPFTIDKNCFESNWSSLIGDGDGYLEVLSVDPPGGSAFPIEYTITLKGDVDVVTGIGEGQWEFTDSLGSSSFLESVPVEVEEATGADGSLLAGSPFTFNSPGAAFVAADVHKKIRITGSVSGNDGLYTIASVVDANNVELREDDTPAAPDGNNGSLGWALTVFNVTTVATVPPANTGIATLEYVCPLNIRCGYCPSNKLLVEGTTSLSLEKPFERLFDRLEEGKPHHVEFISKVGQTASGTVLIAGGGTIT